MDHILVTAMLGRHFQQNWWYLRNVSTSDSPSIYVVGHSLRMAGPVCTKFYLFFDELWHTQGNEHKNKPTTNAHVFKLRYWCIRVDEIRRDSTNSTVQSLSRKAYNFSAVQKIHGHYRNQTIHSETRFIVKWIFIKTDVLTESFVVDIICEFTEHCK